MAKVGGLVGKVLEIDEKTRLLEYVRMRIACRDVTKVPRKVEGTLGLCLHDFIFEREVHEADSVRVLSSGIRVSTSDSQPPRKNTRQKSQQKTSNRARFLQNIPRILKPGPRAISRCQSVHQHPLSAWVTLPLSIQSSRDLKG